jgi:hypothetical protein
MVVYQEKDIVLTAWDLATNTAISGVNTVTITGSKVKHNITKPLINIPLPRERGDGTSLNLFDDDADAFLINIGRLNETVNVTGFLADDGSYSALQRKNDLMTLARDYTYIQISWGGSVDTPNLVQTFYGDIDKCEVDESPGIFGSAQPTGYEQEKYFQVQLNLIKGTPK